MEWKVRYDSYEQQKTMPLDRAKIEAQRAIAEQLALLNENLAIHQEQLEKLLK